MASVLRKRVYIGTCGGDLPSEVGLPEETPRTASERDITYCDSVYPSSRYTSPFLFLKLIP
ncbi:hypothetical protein AKJ37_00990 [candidate division MSBL1 archaeon SCGC-AAA259I09]|uniref:Uncharacterized protein n=1 Tax=candidate division MSBL1 archaeon SCGC-AAA259I09 TaxID=1698267 RepID=A0A133UVH3_9EURY|nr:hypothetical protein AKJ37_00990 [candidate division MSBL1 archaeon SCGC-AAA259I09]